MGGAVQYLKDEEYSIILITFTTGATAYSTLKMKGKDILSAHQDCIEMIYESDNFNNFGLNNYVVDNAGFLIRIKL